MRRVNGREVDDVGSKDATAPVLASIVIRKLERIETTAVCPSCSAAG